MDGAWDPPIADDSGYCIRMSDLEFLDLDENEVRQWANRAYPLGMTHSLYQRFISGLWRALDLDGIADADVRLKGSSVNFYAGRHKEMPTNRRDVLNEFRANYGRVPEPDMLDWIEDALHRQWPVPVRPRRRPFNALYRLRIHRSSSDYDLQISSDEIFRRAVEILEKLGVEPDEALYKHPSYGFIKKDLVVKACPTLDEWRLAASDFLRYNVTVAAFPAVGPPNQEDDPDLAPLSSHFRDTDWIIARPAEALT